MEYRGDESDEGDSVTQVPCPCKGSTKRSGSVSAFGCKEGMGYTNNEHRNAHLQKQQNSNSDKSDKP